MKTYPSIPASSSKKVKGNCFVFVKYDGSNLRAEWNNKNGWHKFGTRKQLFDASDPIYGPAIDLFLNKYGDALAESFRKEKIFRSVRDCTAYFEYFGADSFAGQHKPDDPKDVVLFDVNLYKKGFLSPRDFTRTFKHLDVAEVLFEGVFCDNLVSHVRNETIDIESKYEIRSNIPEGVICKGGSGHQIWMCKIKTNRYREALKTLYESDWTKYWE